MILYVIGLVVGIIILINLAKASKKIVAVHARHTMMRSLEKRGNSRVITMIHRQGSKGILSRFSEKYIDIEDSFSILEAIRKTPAEKAIDFIVHTPGGLVLASSQIARALSRHKGEVRIIVPHYAMSGGTLLALAADKIVMDQNAVLGPVDPQIGGLPASSIMKVLAVKNNDEVDDDTIVFADIAEKSVSQMNAAVTALLVQKGRGEDDAKEVANIMVNGTWTHDYPLTVEFFEENNFDVSTNVPEEVYNLMNVDPTILSIVPSVESAPALPKKNKVKK